MEGVEYLNTAKEIMGNNFIGYNELNLIAERMGFTVPYIIPEIPYSIKELEDKCEDYILVLGISEMLNGEKLTIKALHSRFGTRPDISEPCFYNQDWYLDEAFIFEFLQNRWYLVKKEVITSSRSLNPERILRSNVHFPSAIIAIYTFFVFYLCKNEILWKHDFIWCSDLDHNGDRIYVGKYLDIDLKNRNGFSIHRNLTLRNCYGSIDVF